MTRWLPETDDQRGPTQKCYITSAIVTKTDASLLIFCINNEALGVTKGCIGDVNIKAISAGEGDGFSGSVLSRPRAHAYLLVGALEHPLVALPLGEDGRGRDGVRGLAGGGRPRQRAVGAPGLVLVRPVLAVLLAVAVPRLEDAVAVVALELPVLAALQGDNSIGLKNYPKTIIDTLSKRLSKRLQEL